MRPHTAAPCAMRRSVTTAPRCPGSPHTPGLPRSAEDALPNDLRALQISTFFQAPALIPPALAATLFIVRAQPSGGSQIRLRALSAGAETAPTPEPLMATVHADPPPQHATPGSTWVHER